MNAMIDHRGPDDEGYLLAGESGVQAWLGDDSADGHGAPTAGTLRHIAEASATEARLGFGHRRLSIIDLSQLGHQPMSYAEGRYWITYNGEVYNYREIRVELEELGHQFLSGSDTEVVLASYAEWGVDCLHRFNGMWAFAIFDCLEQTVFIARDRFGVKPLYYWVSPAGMIALGSEIKQFTVLSEWQAVANAQRSYDFLVWSLLDHTEETLFQNVFQLEPGHGALLRLQDLDSSLTNGRIRSQAWYQLQPAPFMGDFSLATSRFRDLFADSVALRLRSDVAIGSCLSGGLDSSSIVSLVNRQLKVQGIDGRQKTFSACADVERFDERRWIEQVVADTGVEAHMVTPDVAAMFDDLERLTWHQDEPFGSSSIFAQWSVFGLAAGAGVRVMLDGQGADEQLAGYHSFFAPRLATLLRQFRWGTLLQELSAMGRLHGYPSSRGLMYLGKGLLPESIKDFLRARLGFAHASPSWINLDALGADGVNPFDQIGAEKSASIGELSAKMLTTSNLRMLLHWEDRNSMAHSIESRIPFLDYRLVEFVLGLPDEFKLSGGVTKRVLRAAMQGILVDPVRNRMDKLGFVTPEDVWVREQAPGRFREWLIRAVEASQGVIRPEAVAMLDGMIEGRTPYNHAIWRMISYGAWIEQFGVKKCP